MARTQKNKATAHHLGLLKVSTKVHLVLNSILKKKKRDQLIAFVLSDFYFFCG